MAEEKPKEKKVEITRNETRTFKYCNDVCFEFEMTVSNPETALAEIADFLALMEVASTELKELKKEFAAKIEKPKEKKKDTTGTTADVKTPEPSTTGGKK